MFFEVTTEQGKTLINADHIIQIESHKTGCYLYLIDYDAGIKVNEPYDFFKYKLDVESMPNHSGESKAVKEFRDWKETAQKLIDRSHPRGTGDPIERGLRFGDIEEET